MKAILAAIAILFFCNGVATAQCDRASEVMTHIEQNYPHVYETRRSITGPAARHYVLQVILVVNSVDTIPDDIADRVNSIIKRVETLWYFFINDRVSVLTVDAQDCILTVDNVDRDFHEAVMAR